MILTQSPLVVPSLFDKRKMGAKFLDANLIREALERWDAGGLAFLYRGGFGRKCKLSEVLKECVKEKDVRDGSSLVDLHPTRRVAPCRWLDGTTPLINKGHTLFLKSWV
jgi:hypothetical protein